MKKSLLIFIFGIISYNLTGQSLRGLNLNSYKYIVVESTTHKNAKKILLKKLKSAGYNVLDSGKDFPEDLEKDNLLALFLNSTESCDLLKCRATIYLTTSDGSLVWQSATALSGISFGNALKQAVSPFKAYNYKYVQ